MKNLSYLAALCLLPLTLTTGCDKGDPQTSATGSGTDTSGDTDSGGTTGASDSDTSTSGGTTAGSASDGGTGAATGGQESATDGTGVTTTGETAGTTGGEPDPAVVEACEKICNKFLECYPEEDLQLCLEDCSTSVSPDPECVDPIVKLYECGAAQTCEVIDGPNDFCVEEEEAVPAECWDGGGGDCTVGVGGNEQGTECGYVEMCDGVEIEMDCKGDTCTCLENGVEYASCPIMEACTDPNATTAYAESCCGI